MEFQSKRIEKTLEVLKENGRRKICSLLPMPYKPCGYKKGNKLPYPDETWQQFKEGGRFEGYDKHAWFYKEFKTPKIKENSKLYLVVKTSKKTPWDAENPQSILYLNGKAVQGLDLHHTKVLLKPETEYKMHCYLYTGMYKNQRYDMEFFLREDSIAEEELYYDILTAHEAAKCFDEKNENFIAIERELEAAADIIDFTDAESDDYKKSIECAREFLKKAFYTEINEKAPVVSCIGHTHIDLAWLWTFAQTKEKGQRSFSTALKLMEEYPEYKFMSSQAQLYQFVKEEAPDIYDKIKERINEQRWEAEGAMWVEADCNLSGGESLVRQLLYGKQFFREEFGRECKILWLPDVFGYSAALPQILRKANVEYFVTSKISWNEFNKLPYDAFWWKGIDGTEIYSYLLTCQENKKASEGDRETVYNGFIDPSYVLGTWKRFQQKDMSRNTLLTYGYGDGGGGSTTQMLQKQRRLKYGFNGIPRTVSEFAGDFLEKSKSDFEKSSEELNRTCRWVGELYLEKHRGTYTTMAKNKKNNRKSEFLYQNTEKLCTAASVMCNDKYPAEELRSSWKKILLNQFHDIIPGSAIEAVYDDTDVIYKELEEKGKLLINNAMNKICSQIDSDGGLWIYNPNSCGDFAAARYNGECIELNNLSECGWTTVSNIEIERSVCVKDKQIESKLYIVTFDEYGDIVSLYDKRYDREVVKKGEKFNRIMLYEDYPYAWDAWEVSPYYRQKCRPICEKAVFTPIYDGARAGFRISRRFLKSTITQDIYLYDNLERIDVETELDWQERHLLMRALFPCDINTMKATYEIQFGALERDAHENTSWQQAQFEVCAHKWADVSDGGYGVSIMNDCKYGYSADGGTLGLSLLRGPSGPNPNADFGINRFVYSILPHKGDYREGKTVQQAYALNNSVYVKELKNSKTGNVPQNFSFVSCSSENAVVEAIKQSENGNEIIVRLYDSYNKKENIKLSFGVGIKKAFLCDLEENHLNELPVKNNVICIELSGFEIMTIALIV